MVRVDMEEVKRLGELMTVGQDQNVTRVAVRELVAKGQENDNMGQQQQSADCALLLARTKQSSMDMGKAELGRDKKRDAQQRGQEEHNMGQQQQMLLARTEQRSSWQRPHR